MIKSIVNASPLIALSMINHFDLLWKIFDEVFIAQAVFDEINDASGKNKFGQKELIEAIKNHNISLYTVNDSALVNKLTGKLHKGELETIIGAKELNAEFAIIDEITARNFSAAFSVDTIGTVGILRIAKRRAYINELKPLFLQLHKNKFRISDKILTEILKKENEL
ncbi:MAG: DUF3368 domain-containing protein [Bacteroidales bacterium]|nr:DUF3368 domain-containing protein [Bacteroidales bacterium]